MKNFLLLMLLTILTSTPGQAQFLDKFEKFMDKVTGYEEENTVKSDTIFGRTYGANPGLKMALTKARISKSGEAIFTFVLSTVEDSVSGLRIDPERGFAFNTPEIADSLIEFSLSKPFKVGETNPTDSLNITSKKKKKKKKSERVTLNLEPLTSSPSGKMNNLEEFSLPEDKTVEITAVCFNYPNKLKKLDRIEVAFVSRRGGEMRFFGFTFDNVPVQLSPMAPN